MTALMMTLDDVAGKQPFAAGLVLKHGEIRQIPQTDLGYVHPVPVRGFCGKQQSKYSAVRRACEKHPALCARLLSVEYSAVGFNR